MDKDQVIKDRQALIATLDERAALHQKQLAAIRKCTESFVQGVDLAEQLLAADRHDRLKTHLQMLSGFAVRLIEIAGPGAAACSKAPK